MARTRKATAGPKYSVILPTYNERENLPIVIWLLEDAFAGTARAPGLRVARTVAPGVSEFLRVTGWFMHWNLCRLVPSSYHGPGRLVEDVEDSRPARPVRPVSLWPERLATARPVRLVVHVAHTLPGYRLSHFL